MTTQAYFIVYDSATGDIKRHGKCPLAHVASQARTAKGEAVLLDEQRTGEEARELLITHRVQGGALAVRSEAEIAARRPKPTTPPPTVEQLLTVLKEKHGIEITPEELQQANL